MRDLADRGGEVDLADEQEDDDQAEEDRPVGPSNGSSLQQTAPCREKDEMFNRRSIDRGKKA